MLQKLLSILGKRSQLNGHLEAMLRHMLGAWPDEPARKQWGRRNYFMTGPGPAAEVLQQLVACGMVQVGGCNVQGVRVYHATEKGCRAIGLDISQTRTAVIASRQPRC